MPGLMVSSTRLPRERARSTAERALQTNPESGTADSGYATQQQRAHDAPARAPPPPTMSEPGDDNRFGMPESAFQAARESHGNSPFFRMGMYVPTRREVRTLPPQEVFVILDLWFFEGPVELIPSDVQVAEVKEVLLERSDAASPDVQAIIALCDDYMRPREALEE